METMRAAEQAVAEGSRRHEQLLADTANQTFNSAVDKIVQAIAASRTPQFMPIPFPMSPSSDGRASPFPTISYTPEVRPPGTPPPSSASPH